MNLDKILKEPECLNLVPKLTNKKANKIVMVLKKYDTNYNRFDIVVVNKSVEGDNLIIHDSYLYSNKFNDFPQLASILS